ncbi:MAG: HAD family phosphatase [Niastella sp.]|nr:HAD family phosphatase [Niastella sp.]
MIKPKNIIFDFGGVLYDIDIPKTIEGFMELGFHDIPERYNQYHADPLFQQLEMGNITEQQFYDALIAISGNTVTAQQIRDAWNAMLLTYRTASLQLLPALQKQYRIYLLSNTNQIHYDVFSANITKETGYQNLEMLFHKAYFSHEIHLRKPNADVFEFVLQDAGLKSEETLFIDDSYNNIDAAKALGFKTHLMLPAERIELLGL